MNIKKKSSIIIVIFSILVLTNGVGFYFALNKIKTANISLIKQTEITQDFLNLKYFLKNLQEVSTDIALMGEEESLKEIDELEEAYNKLIKN